MEPIWIKLFDFVPNWELGPNSAAAEQLARARGNDAWGVFGHGREG